MRPRSTLLAVAGTALLAVASAGMRTPVTAVAPGHSNSSAPTRHVQPLGSVNLGRLAAQPATGAQRAVRYTVLPEHDRHSAVDYLLRTHATLGGAAAPAATVQTTPNPSASGINGINITEMEGAGTGNWAGSNGGLEPPDQALCVGNGYVLEGVNTAWKVWSTSGAPLTAAVPITQFFNIAPAGRVGPSSFVSDPRCVYDAQTGRFFALTLEADEANGLTQVPFVRSHTYFAVSKTGDPTGDWWIYNIDITDDGAMGTPVHPTCPCIDDQPLMGLDRYGLYLSANEYSDAEIVPVPLPAGAGSGVNMLFNTPPDFRNGQAQVYALSKADLIKGTAAPVQSFDTADASKWPLPAQDQGTRGALWSSLQPAFSPPGDHTPTPPGGAEFLMSQLDFATTGDNRIAVWALTNTSSLDTATPSLQLKNTIITTKNPGETYTAPGFGVDQKAGPHPLGDQCGCNEEQINANDDRMNQVMLTNGVLWSGLNTALPGIDDSNPHPRAGIMYFAVQPGIDGSGNLIATMLRDGYVQVPRASVIFPSIAASPAGPVGMFFTLSGVDYFPSAAWTRLDGLGPSDAPVVHVSGAGTRPEDGFTGYPLTNEAGVPLDPQGGNGVSRWGDYSAAGVDENGCLWGSAEYIPDGPRDANAGDWGTFITRVQPSGCNEPAFVPPSAQLKLDPCKPLFTDPAGDDQLNAIFAPVPGTQGQNPQLDIIAGDIRLSADGTTLVVTLTMNNLSTKLATGGEANEYYMYWSYGGKSYYSNVAVDSTGTATYVDGTVDPNGARARRSGAPNDSGALTLGPNGTVVINVPVSVVGNVHPHTLVQNAHAETRELEGAVVLQYDAAGPGNDYEAGSVCATAQARAQPGSGTGAGAPGNAATAAIGLPNTAAAAGGGGATAAGALGLLALGLRAVRRRRHQGAH